MHHCNLFGSFWMALWNHSLGVLWYCTWAAACNTYVNGNHSPCSAPLMLNRASSDGARSGEKVGWDNIVNPSDAKAIQVFVTDMWLHIVMLQYYSTWPLSLALLRDSAPVLLVFHSTFHCWLFFRHYNFILWTFWPSQHIISTYCDPGCS
jgi:hypothetical protein